MTRKLNILIVDDETCVRETIEQMLIDFGFKISLANDGFGAIKLVESEDFDVILLDIKMPGINGVETLKRIKSIHPSIKAIMMTGFPSDTLIEEAMEGGANCVFYKPFNIEDLIEKINSIT